MKVLLLGGTGEARELAARLVAEGVEVTSSLAGRTKDARPVDGEVRIGGFGGITGMARWLRDHPVDAVVDATHPFAATITEHAVEAARRRQVPLLVLRRPGWSAGPDDDWWWEDTVEDAAAGLRAVGSRVFLTIGRQQLNAFSRTGLWTLARCIEPPRFDTRWCIILLDRGPFTLESELDTLTHHEIDVVVTKDSGGPQTAAKLTAARLLGIPVVIIRRPPVPGAIDVVGTVEAAIGWLRALA
jgi:precorrin-6A/cobalt-precorrin-6A reductase